MTKYLRFTMTAPNRVASSAFVTLSHGSSWSASAVLDGDGRRVRQTTIGHLDERGAMLAMAELLGASFAAPRTGLGSAATIVGIDPHPVEALRSRRMPGIQS